MALYSSRPCIAIIGAGIIGLSAAYELAVRRGMRVSIFDTRPPGRGASWAAAGMLAPAFEAPDVPGIHPRLLELCLQGASMWPGFAEELTARAGMEVGFNRSPSLAVAMDAAEAERLTRLAARLAGARVEHRTMTSGDLVAREPALSPDVQGGLELPSDLRVNNRQVVSALITALRANANVRFRAGPAPLKSANGRVRLDGHDAILAAAGWETAIIKVEEQGQLFSLVNWEAALDDIDCHGGQMLSVADGTGVPKHVVRSGHLYLVPRGGQLVIGATVEPGRVLDEPEDEVIEALRRDAVRLCPGLADAPVVERWVGIRPGTPDQGPFIGATATPGLFVAAGHFRNGILLAPVTARMIADQILGEEAGDLADAFSVRRAYAATA